MCEYCEKDMNFGEFCAIKEGRTFHGYVWLHSDRLHLSMIDDDAGADDRDYSFISNGIRIDYCPVCGKRLGPCA